MTWTLKSDPVASALTYSRVLEEKLTFPVTHETACPPVSILKSTVKVSPTVTLEAEDCISKVAVAGAAKAWGRYIAPTRTKIRSFENKWRS